MKLRTLEKKDLFNCHYHVIGFLGSGPERGRSPVEWGDYPYVPPSRDQKPARQALVPASQASEPARQASEPAREASEPASQASDDH